MLVCRHYRLPSETRSYVFRRGAALPRLLIEVLPIGSAGHRVVIPEKASLSKLRKQELDDVFERLGEESIRLVLRSGVLAGFGLL